MNSLLKVALITWLSMAAISSGQQAVAMDLKDAPANIEIGYLVKLYEAVTFDHGMHIDMYGCGSCHHHTTGESPENDSCKKCHANSAATEEVSCSGCHVLNVAQTSSLSVTTKNANSLYHIDKTGLKGALHLQCLGCHQTESGPTGCLDCHNFTAAGRKRFAVKN
jgi:hypothetical protein